MHVLVIVAKLRAEARLQLKLEFVFCLLLCFAQFVFVEFEKPMRFKLDFGSKTSANENFRKRIGLKDYIHRQPGRRSTYQPSPRCTPPRESNQSATQG